MIYNVTIFMVTMKGAGLLKLILCLGALFYDKNVPAKIRKI